ncbi:MAG: alpha-amylase family glycosyl hydrolase [Bacteroides sp.]|nr:alpha-amylase family glycosyl hydrolase [Bacteroides sp.]
MKQFKLISFFLFCVLVGSLNACSDDNNTTPDNPETPEPEETEEWTTLTASPDEWDGEKRADISYQLLVYSFADSNNDGYGDFQGLIKKLDYINSLGVNAIWLSPIHPCSSYHGYDVTDYDAVNEKFGTQSDFDQLVAAAHNLDIKIYLDYVLNHTSAEHPWFVNASASEDSEYRDYYIFSQDPATDIAAGNIAMISSEGSSGYNASEWYALSGNESVTGVYQFVLDWTNSTRPTVTVTRAATADADNTATDTGSDKFLYYGDGICKKFYDNGDGTYRLTVNLDTNWGFLIRTSSTLWDNYKYGASSSSDRLTLGEAFTLAQGSSAADIKFDFMDQWYYHSNFYTASFADLNYGDIDELESSATFQAMVGSAKKWLDKGVDGFRLDAVKHIYHNQTSSENPTFLKAFYDELNAYYQGLGNTDDLYMVGEVLSESSDVAPYYAGLPAFFEFSFWYRLDWAINNNTGCYFAKDIIGYQDLYAAYRSDYIEATKLSNHDEARTASELGKSLAKEKLAGAVLLTSGGSPYIYYGEELGLYGTQDNGDEYVRGPMLWGDASVTSYTDKIDAGVASSIASVTEQQADANSLLNVYLTFTKLRNTYPALAKGAMSKHSVYNDSNTSAGLPIAAWYMTYGSDKMLVVHNFGSSTVEISLTDNLEKAVGINGDIQVKAGSSETALQMGAYSSVVFLVN